MCPSLPSLAGASRRALAGALLVGAATAACANVARAPAALTPDAARLAGWVAASADHRNRPFVVIDKRAARLWVFDASGTPRGSTPVLLGLAVGDHTVPGIGDRPLADVQPHERTTPAGRFAIEPGINTKGEDIFWVDYDAAVSMHRVRPTVAAERRLERLASPTVADNRISYGCINIPAAFYDGVLKPMLARHAGTAYVLPDTRPLASVFPALAGARVAAAKPAPSARD